ncbi:phosphoribosylanthranilate isomerase [Clostridium cellulovorans]|uniref:N-(5'-phosphoribosyl)anthranilate isomerase n=1 Tax=Clostridium cellulovorans (strain ATCC 35296 / DSM 3052 / OCM 3 / 743B) TaxID=573061 RepID=D9SN38_CLOC7|nr:phosphoribosylanthranilate isomerase [Clostridium cellulovorans]ADL51904.1 Phosphoribosylanthranilate isomerase [Clostridium cellulovorans 743B]
MSKVKVCGIRDIEIAKYTKSLGADALGFILCESKRRIDKKLLTEITTNIGNDIEKVGVFMNQSIDTIKEFYEDGGLTIVQLHGDEDNSFIKKLPYKIIKSFNVETFEEIKNALSYEVPYVLLEGKGALRGGNGNSFHWELLSKLSKAEKERIILAGGINSSNVISAINTANPYMIDVSSSLEVEGVKNKEKIKEFMKIIRGHNYEL